MLTSDQFARFTASPFFTIWAHPRKTLRRVLAEDQRWHVIWLSALWGVSKVLDRASTHNYGERFSTGMILGVAVAAGPVVGWLGTWLVADLLRRTGRWLGGTGGQAHLRVAFAWSALPIILALPLWVPALWLSGSGMFTEEMPRVETQPLLAVPLVTMALAELGMFAWGVVLLCHMVAEAQGFRSAWRGLANVLLTSAIIFAAVFSLVPSDRFHAASPVKQLPIEEPVRPTEDAP